MTLDRKRFAEFVKSDAVNLHAELFADEMFHKLFEASNYDGKAFLQRVPFPASRVNFLN